jgi:hypothetical protein
LRSRRRHIALLIACCALLAGVACNSCYSVTLISDKADKTAQAKTSQASAALVRNLAQDEAAGGHTLSRHVGQSDDELRQRLQRERITAASTYTDRSAAETAVGIAISSHRDKIREWLSRAGGHPNLVLDYDFPRPIGSTLHRNEPRSVPCLHALVVLKWKPPSDYYVLTSYPECK